MKHFGCTCNEQYHNPRTGLITYVLTPPDGECAIEIMSRPEVTTILKEQHRAGFIHISFAVGSRANVNNKTKELEAKGYTCISGPRITGDGFYESQIVGPEGILIEITI